MYMYAKSTEYDKWLACQLIMAGLAIHLEEKF